MIMCRDVPQSVPHILDVTLILTPVQPVPSGVVIQYFLNQYTSLE